MCRLSRLSKSFIVMNYTTGVCRSYPCVLGCTCSVGCGDPTAAGLCLPVETHILAQQVCSQMLFVTHYYDQKRLFACKDNVLNVRHTNVKCHYVY